MTRRAAAVALTVATSLTATSSGALGAQEPAPGFEWENATELSYVATGGNASSSTLGLKSTLTGTGEPNLFKVELGGIRAESKITTRTATGTPTDFTVTKTTRTDVTAESYFARGRYDRQLDGAFGFAGAGWERNTFAGVANRFSIVAGMGRTWFDAPSGRLKTDLGGTYTVQKDVEPEPGADDSFAGLRLTIEAQRSITESATLASGLIVDESLMTTRDLRGDWVNSLAVAISEGLALKTSLQMLFDNEPAFRRVPLVDGTGTPTGETVLSEGNKIDRVFTFTMVIRL
jgi:putative salt-induced outer membrane protein YdiY